jgi:pyruvate dehydrogenase E2 component (dihydrolipoamide acetyltransferase)
MSIFKLPDLGEGLHEAEITQWHVAVGDAVEPDQPLLSVETAKAIVEIPSPRGGKISRLWGRPGDILEVGAPLVEFAGAAGSAESPGSVPRSAVPGTADRGTGARADAGTVVGRVEATNRVANEAPTAVGRPAVGIRTTPAVRALARRLEVDLSVVTPSGPEDTITAADVERVARIFKEVGPLETLRGVRRAMARSMTQAHAEVAAVTVVDDADIAAWRPDDDIMLRLIRAIVAACRAEPALNAWFDSHAVGRRLLRKVDLGIAVDTPDGLFVPVLRDAGNRAPEDLRRGLDAMKRDVRERTIPPEEMRGNTFTLSNFGTFGGRYADPVVMPPTVAILGAGKIRDAVVAVDGRPAVHRVVPLSLTFDHRAVTGGEATRFLAAAIADLQKESSHGE